MDETYVKVGGKWKYLFRAVDKHGRLIDFMLNGPAKHACDLPFPRKSADDDASLVAILDRHRPARFFQTMKTAAATTKGFEVMRMIRRGHCLTCKPHVKDEVRFVNKLFDVYSVAA